jgi:hypothetical protein
MDGLVTVLAGMVVLALPLAVWLKLRARTKRARELEDIKQLATERSRWLDELHSHLDALDEKGSEHGSTASEWETTGRYQPQVSSAHKPVLHKDVTLKGFKSAMESMYSEPPYKAPVGYRIVCISPKEDESISEWWEDLDFENRARAEDCVRRMRGATSGEAYWKVQVRPTAGTLIGRRLARQLIVG